MYDAKWWVGVVIDVDEEGKEDVQVKFMHPPGPSRSFKLPNIDDVCWVPNEHMLCKIGIPNTTSGRTYTIATNDRELTEERFQSTKQ